MNHPTKSKILKKNDFKALYINEAIEIGYLTDDEDPKKDPIHCSQPEEINEPWVTFTPADYFGLALSGGGVRSATFNLGLLQALYKNGVLKHRKKDQLESRVDYLSTVSGGGYIGAFWSQWRKHHPGKIFPGTTEGLDPTEKPGKLSEPEEIRHLRKYSRFLIPAKGIGTDFFKAVISVLQGAIPSFMVAFSLVVCLTCFWALLASGTMKFSLFIADNLFQFRFLSWSMAALIGVILTMLLMLLLRFCRWARWDCVVFSLFFIGVIGGSTWCVFIGSLIQQGPLPTGLGPIANDKVAQAYFFNWPLLAPSIAFAAMLLWVLFTRLLYLRFAKIHHDRHAFNPAEWMDAIMVGLLKLCVLWAVFTGIWEIGVWLQVQALALKPTGGVLAVLAALFVWLRPWLKKEPWKEGEIGWFDHLKPYITTVLANGLVLSMFVLAVVFILEHGLTQDGGRPTLTMLFIPSGILLAALLVFDPARIGIHAFYRQKIVECYLKAGGLGQKSTEEKDKGYNGSDENLLAAKGLGKPLHLICCAANQLHGDLKGTLYRGARSAVLSSEGIAIGNSVVQDEKLYLSSAVTASAAAVNSMMGSINIALGTAVAFVMTAFSVRLGLWVKNPEYRSTSRSENERHWRDQFPGRLFICELLGKSRAEAKNRFVHLSDGGHFENLGLYELIRRHCRYIIVSDAGKDKDFTFDDFGRAVRRVREDFGVEIEIDFDPLRPGPDGLSGQHLVVGSIHYDGLTGIDKGTLIYIKPVLTGDEPVDLFEYHCSNKAFPHDSTLDQFFDEAQWESYRRLGEHAGNAGFCMLADEVEEKQTEELFRGVRLYWSKTPWMKGDAGIRLCAHKDALEKEMTEMSPGLSKEFFGGFDGPDDRKEPWPKDRDLLAKLAAVSDDTKISHPMIAHRIFTFMEEAWFVCQLDLYWAHPLASAWMAHLHRLSAMPSIRCWWILLKAMYGQDFQKFAEKQLRLPPTDTLSTSLKCNLVELAKSPFVKGYAWQRFEELKPAPIRGSIPHRKSSFQFNLALILPEIGDEDQAEIQAGFVLGDMTANTATWYFQHLFVPPELHGGGLTTHLLDQLIHTLKNEHKIRFLRVDFMANDSQNLPLAPHGPAQRQAFIELLDFYKSRGFRFDEGGCGGGQIQRLVRDNTHDG